MRKIIGIVSLAMLLGAPAFGATTASLDLYVGLNGNNHAAAYENCLPVLYDNYSEIGGDSYPVDSVISWSVRAKADGQYDNGTTTTNIWGVANVVWDLALQKNVSGTWTNVGTATGAPSDFGLGSAPIQGVGHADTAGFLSTINDGDNDGDTGCNATDVTAAAAFAYAYNSVPEGTSPSPGTIRDEAANNGPNLRRSQLPSTLGYPTGSTAASGTLMGMGAGYEQFSSLVASGPPFGPERAGVGLPAGYALSCLLGDKVIAEGQINLKGLTSGDYRLHITPGKGNNFLRGDSSTCDEDLAGNFAVAFPTANVLGHDIAFSIAAPPCTDPVVQSAVSRRYHRFTSTEPLPGTPWDINLPIGTGATAGVECRQGGPQLIVVTYDQPLDTAVTPSVVPSAGLLGAVTVSGSQVLIALSNVPNRTTCGTVTINGAKSNAGACTQTVAKVIKFRYRLGDVDGAFGAIGNDVTLIRQQPTSTSNPCTASNFRFDLDCNNRILGNDTTILRQNTGGVDNSVCTAP